jgi:hypothetical protein
MLSLASELLLPFDDESELVEKLRPVPSPA